MGLRGGPRWPCSWAAWPGAKGHGGLWWALGGWARGLQKRLQVGPAPLAVAPAVALEPAGTGLEQKTGASLMRWELVGRISQHPRLNLSAPTLWGVLGLCAVVRAQVPAGQACPGWWPLCGPQGPSFHQCPRPASLSSPVASRPCPRAGQVRPCEQGKDRHSGASSQPCSHPHPGPGHTCHSPGCTRCWGEDDGLEVRGRGGERHWQLQGALTAGGLAGHRPLHGYKSGVPADLHKAWGPTWAECGRGATPHHVEAEIAPPGQSGSCVPSHRS